MKKRDHLPLLGINIIDLTSRLPGPLATYKLSKLGAKIIKIEDTDTPDPFSYSKGLFHEWYHNINHEKEIITLPFKSKDSIRTIHEYIKKSDGVISSLPFKVKENLKLSDSETQNTFEQKVFINLNASKNKIGPLHDLGILSLTKLLKFHLESQKNKSIIAPPFLPVAGLNFSSKIENMFLALMIKVLKTNQSQIGNVYLDQSTDELAGAFLPSLKHKDEYTFSHNGLYPGYNIYSLKDGHYAILSLLEKKYWIEFLKASGLEKILDEKSRQDVKSFSTLSTYFQTLNKNGLDTLIKDFSLNCINTL